MWRVNIEPDACHVEDTLSILLGKWKPIILLQIMKHQTVRFSELQQYIPNISQKMLSKHLKELEEEEIIKRVVYPQVPPKVEYSITEYGNTLSSLLHAMHEWGEAHRMRKLMVNKNS